MNRATTTPTKENQQLRLQNVAGPAQISEKYNRTEREKNKRTGWRILSLDRGGKWDLLDAPNWLLIPSCESKADHLTPISKGAGCMRVFEYSPKCCHFFHIPSFGRHATMTNPMNLIAAASLLILSAANHDPVSAFQSPAVAASSSSSCLIRRRRPEHVVVGSPSRPTTTPSVPLLASSPYDYDDDDDDDTEGYEIRDGGGGGRNSNNNGNNDNGNRPPLRPETTFGAENVPADFRPSNEYLNLVRQPTFGWASQECGDAGLAIRLAFVYAGFFFLV